MATLAELTEDQRTMVMRRWEVLRPHVDDDIPLSAAAREAGVPLRTAQRWLARYRASGLVGLARLGRADRGQRRFPDEMVRLIEGLALCRPRPLIASIAAQPRAGLTLRVNCHGQLHPRG